MNCKHYTKKDFSAFISIVFQHIRIPHYYCFKDIIIYRMICFASTIKWTPVRSSNKARLNAFFLNLNWIEIEPQFSLNLGTNLLRHFL